MQHTKKKMPAQKNDGPPGIDRASFEAFKAQMLEQLQRFKKPDAEKPLRLARNAALGRYLNRSDMTIWRWKRSKELNFPKAIVINGIEYNDLDLVDAWLETKVAQ